MSVNTLRSPIAKGTGNLRALEHETYERYDEHNGSAEITFFYWRAIVSGLEQGKFRTESSSISDIALVLIGTVFLALAVWLSVQIVFPHWG